MITIETETTGRKMGGIIIREIGDFKVKRWILEERGVRIWAGFMWLRIWTSGLLLCKGKRIVVFRKSRFLTE
jgi:hypothetical protein